MWPRALCFLNMQCILLADVLGSSSRTCTSWYQVLSKTTKDANSTARILGYLSTLLAPAPLPPRPLQSPSMSKIIAAAVKG